MEVTLQILHGRLKSGTGDPKVEGFTIRQPRFVIGGDAGCNMVCRSRLVSPQHCEITLSGRQATLQDLGSEHGTFVNGIRVEGATILKTGDLLKIGRLEFFVSVGPVPTAMGPSSKPEESVGPERDTVAMSAASSDTLVDAPPAKAPADGTESVDDLVTQLLEEADRKDRELRKSDPAARYLKVEIPAPSKAAENPASEGEQEEERRQRPARKRPIKLPPGKLVQGPVITGKDSVNAAQQALEELLRSPRK